MSVISRRIRGRRAVAAGALGAIGVPATHRPASELPEARSAVAEAGPAGRPATGSMPMPSPGTTHADVRTGVGQDDGVRPIGGRSARGCSARTCSSRPRSARQARSPRHQGIDGVQRAEDVAGPYDVIARVQAPGMEELGRLVVARIQGVDGVSRTLTWTTIRW
jgi:DNA-binding Lrp family transcriptional regulator